MTAPNGPNVFDLGATPEESPLVRLSTVLEHMDGQGRTTRVRSMLTEVPDGAWDAFDVQAAVAAEMDQDADPLSLAHSVARVVATSAGAGYDFSETNVGPRGRAESFADRFSERLAAAAGTHPEDEGANVQLDRCERDLERLLGRAMKSRGLVSERGDRVWVAGEWQTGDRSRDPAKERTALLATIAVSMFMSALEWRPSRREQTRSLLPRLPKRFIFSEIDEQAARSARREVDQL